MMRSFRHWSPGYLLHRAMEKIYRINHAEEPWLTPQANEILSSWLRRTDAGLEFGSGRSTIWFAKRCGKLTSVEHNPEWYNRVSEELTGISLIDVNYLLFPGKDHRDPSESDYVQVANRFQEGSLDFVLIDGIYRDACVLAVLEKIRDGGLLIIDNVHLYYPSRSRSPNAVRYDGQPVSQKWRLAYDILQSWRWIWTSNHVSDTAIIIKQN